MMTSGLLWHEPNRHVPLDSRVDAAAERFLERFGQEPNVCLVPPEEHAVVTTITVKPDTRMRAGSIMVGYDPDDHDATRWRPQPKQFSDADVVLLDAEGNEVNRYRAPAPKKAAKAPSAPKRSRTPAREAAKTP